MAQRDDLEVEAEPLQRQDLLGDEGLRQARIALDQDGDAAGQGGQAYRLRRSSRLLAAGRQPGRRQPGDPLQPLQHRRPHLLGQHRHRRQRPQGRGHLLPARARRRRAASAPAPAAAPARRADTARAAAWCAAPTAPACRRRGSRRTCCSRPWRRPRGRARRSVSTRASKVIASSLAVARGARLEGQPLLDRHERPHQQDGAMRQAGIVLVGAEHPVDQLGPVAAAARRHQDEVLARHLVLGLLAGCVGHGALEIAREPHLLGQRPPCPESRASGSKICGRP